MYIILHPSRDYKLRWSKILVYLFLFQIISVDTVSKSVSRLSSKKGPAMFGQSRQVCNFGCPNLKIPIDGFSSGAFSCLSNKDRQKFILPTYSGAIIFVFVNAIQKCNRLQQFCLSTLQSVIGMLRLLRQPVAVIRYTHLG